MILYLFYHLMLIANLLITPKNVVPHKNYIPRLNTIQVSLWTRNEATIAVHNHFTLAFRMLLSI